MQASIATADSIRRLLQAQVAAWNAGDAEAWCRDFTPDAGFVNILGMYFCGRDANARRHGELFAGLFAGSHLAMLELSVRELDASVAIADAVLDLTQFRGLPPGIRATSGNELLRTRMHYVLIRAAENWRIVFAQNTAVMPMPVVA